MDVGQADDSDDRELEWLSDEELDKIIAEEDLQSQGDYDAIIDGVDEDG